MTDDRTRREAPGRSDKTGGWHERLVRAIGDNQQALGRLNETHADSARRFGEVFIGRAKTIADVAKVTRALYGIAKIATSPKHSRLEIGGEPLSRAVSNNNAGSGPGGGVTFNLWDEEEEKRHRRAYGLEK